MLPCKGSVLLFCTMGPPNGWDFISLCFSASLASRSQRQTDPGQQAMSNRLLARMSPKAQPKRSVIKEAISTKHCARERLTLRMRKQGVGRGESWQV